MTEDQARTIHKHWRAKSRGPCPHSMLEIEDVPGGYRAGSYFCIDCGAHITGTNPTDPDLPKETLPRL